MVLCKAFPYAWAYLSPVASDLPRSRKAAGIFLQVHNALALASPETQEFGSHLETRAASRGAFLLRFVRDPSLRIV